MTLPSNVPAPPPGPTPPPSGGTPHPQYTAPAQFAAAPVATASPFAGIPVRDYVTDAVSALLLIVSLFMLWTINFVYDGPEAVNAAGNIAVLLITIVSILSLGLTYVWRAGAFGPTWNYRKMQDLRLAANVPYVVLVLVYLVIALVQTDGVTGVGVLGQAATFGLAGALLAAQPRKAELGAQADDAGRDQRWMYALLGITGLAVLTGLVQLIKMLVSLDGFGGWYLMGTISSGLLSLVLLVGLALRILAKSEASRLVAVGLGLAGIFLALVSLNGGAHANAAFNGNSFALSVFWWLPFGAIAAAPSLSRRMLPVEPKSKALQAHHLVLDATLLVAAVAVFSAIGTLISTRGYSDGALTAQLVMTMLFSVILGVGALVVKQAFRGNVTQGYMLSSAFAGVVFVLFLVLVIMASVGDYSFGWMSGLLLLITFVIPAALLGLLWVPAASRNEYKAMKGGLPGNRGFSFDGAPGQAAPPAAPVAFAMGTEQLLAEAANPATAGTRLRDLALNHPQTHDAIIANPGTYAELRDWLLQMRNSSPAQTTADQTAADPLLLEASNPSTAGVRLRDLAVAHPHLHEAILANPSTYDGLRDWITAQQPVQSVEETPAVVVPVQDEPSFFGDPVAGQPVEEPAVEVPVDEELVVDSASAEVVAEAPQVNETVDEEPVPDSLVLEKPASEDLLAGAPETDNPAAAEGHVNEPEFDLPILGTPNVADPVLFGMDEATTAADEPEVDESITQMLFSRKDSIAQEERATPESDVAAVVSGGTEEAPQATEWASDVDDEATLLKSDIHEDPLMHEASDPSTPAVRLQELAGTHPQLHQAILANPSAYDGLREWITAQRVQDHDPVAPVIESDTNPAEEVSTDVPTDETIGNFDADDQATMLRSYVTDDEVRPETQIDPLLAEASDPLTAPARLQELAGSYPHVHEAILANPAAYDGLRQWILSLQPAVQQPAVHEAPVVQPVQSVDPLLAEASDPLTAPARLQELAGSYPHVHEAILANPAAYDGLRQWILSMQPAVHEAPVVQPVQSVDPLLAEASDPLTAPARLQELAGSYPHVHEAILANPAAYDGLRQWILSLQPAVHEAPVVQSVDPLLAEASDPLTAPARLQELAATHQELHAAIAGNPAAYPQLLQWLAQVNAPGVAEALSRR